ncbi:unnamed protein product [Mytilus edulis]|uniref:Uncharacterized protein n=1 Tax=Mytilus edulis TaxID=6550 RepID=A0A8S3PM84_MYTED|nr:unnamed protein product [Mytilus edulis]
MTIEQSTQTDNNDEDNEQPGYVIQQDPFKEECRYCFCKPCITDDQHRQLWWHGHNQDISSCEVREGISYQSGIDMEESRLDPENITEIPPPRTSRIEASPKHDSVTEIFFDIEATGLMHLMSDYHQHPHATPTDQAPAIISIYNQQRGLCMPSQEKMEITRGGVRGRGKSSAIRGRETTSNPLRKKKKIYDMYDEPASKGRKPVLLPLSYYVTAWCTKHNRCMQNGQINDAVTEKINYARKTLRKLS